mmetsp:Transcript_20522/g.50628  ORF Transcript_20522/g.50628 Transcript_20522/m.50628 type:complete len:215 (-) Transcript_20522:316-960(-)
MLAFQYNRHGEFGDALDRFLAVLKTSMSYRSLAHDLSWYGVESGEAHDAAAAYFASSRRLKEEYTRKAMLAYKNSAFESVREGGNVGDLYPSHAWNWFGLSLKRAGEFQMALRAYRWAIAKSPAPNSQMIINDTLISLWLATQMTDEEIDAHNKKMMEVQVQRCKNLTTKAKVRRFECMAINCENRSTESGGQLLQCTKCTKAKYCCKACQVEH